MVLEKKSPKQFLSFVMLEFAPCVPLGLSLWDKFIRGGTQMNNQFLIVEPSAIPLPSPIVDQAKREGRLVRVEVAQFMTASPFIWSMEIA